MRKLWIDNQPVIGSDGIRTVIDPAYEEFLETKHVHWEIEAGMKSWWYPYQD